jgi:hypothetical protein
MYATPYIHPEGFGSIGFLSDIQDDSITVADPIFGTMTVSPDDCFGVVSSETGTVLPGVRPILIASPTSTHLLTEPERMVANEAEVVMLRPMHYEGEEFPSGYPHAWEIIKRWRNGVAPDWRTVALAAIFARFSIQRPIEEAEMFYRKFGPRIRRALLEGRVPTEHALTQMPGIKGTRAVSIREKATKQGPAGSYSWDDIPATLEIFDWAPYVVEQMSSPDFGEDYTRRFRNRLALEWLPAGLGVAKLSFTMMLVGRDASCMDTRMQRLFFGEYEQEQMAFPPVIEGAYDEEAIKASKARAKWMKTTSYRQRPTKKLMRWKQDRGLMYGGEHGERGVRPSALDAYVALEAKLKDTPYFDPQWPMPYAKAQWMMWETLGRTATTAQHGALWEVLDPLIRDIDTGAL